ncbi:transposase [Flammeovirga sp. MY04]|uniref:transposase n=1 Tax=Flammeovirga sp. MY04 TaxID=1191459 RepID=UPI00080621E3|nr:transposase [Flammeovirga sp. MY04]
MKKQLPNRQSIRLKGYDYSKAGLYFITICVRNRFHLFGRVENQKMILNDAGKMVEKWYWKLEEKFDVVKCREMVVMPNHFHCVVEIVEGESGDDNFKKEGGDINDNKEGKSIYEKKVGRELNYKNHSRDLNHNKEGSDLNYYKEGRHVGLPVRGQYEGDIFIGRIVQWFKTMSTNEYIKGVKEKNWKRFNKRLWHRNYWEYIIRNDGEYARIAKYIIDNPAKWEKDKLNNGNENTVLEPIADYAIEKWMI